MIVKLDIPVRCVQKKTETKYFLQYLQNSGDDDKIWYTVSWINLLRIDLNFFTSPEKCLYTTLWNLGTCYHWVVTKRNSRIHPILTMASKFARFEFSWKYCKRRCTEHASLMWSYLFTTDKWLPQWRHGQTWPTLFSVAVSVRSDHWSVMHILYTFYCISPHTL